MDRDSTRDQGGRSEDVVVDEGVVVEEIRTTNTGEVVGTAVTDVSAAGVTTEEVVVREGDLPGQIATTTANVTGRDVEPAFTGGEAASHAQRMIEQVQDGMSVVDASGEDLGKVNYIKMGDPEAVTGHGEYSEGDGGLLDDAEGLFGVEAEPKVDESLRGRLIRIGFIKFGGGLLRRAHYATAEQIASVSGDTVTLSVMKDDLARES